MPNDVNVMVPTQIAAILRLDERNGITAVPWDQLPAPVPKNRKNRKARRAERKATR